MKIYSMTATFGKLEHETLILQPGLNIIEAPNEWGKSTWCAFLVAMLYGMDTRAHSTKSALADKERYAPWSGTPMSGRIDLNWNGRDITVERAPKGRIPFGEFKAYETASGLAVPELTAANCGQLLLGVEKSVFLRSGFLRLTDLPVTQDDALRRRLNALVTTGDESGTADTLAQKLKELKNRCRFNRSGLLPQAEQQKEELTHKLRDLDMLQTQAEDFSRQKTALQQQIDALENHKAALLYAAAQEDARQVAQTAAEKQLREQALREAQDKCTAIPSQKDAQTALDTLRILEQQLDDLQRSQRLQAAPPEKPHAPKAFREMNSQEAIAAAQADAAAFHRAKRPIPLLFFLMAALCGAAGGVWGYVSESLYGLLLLIPTVLFCIPGVFLWIRSGKIRKRLAETYESTDPKAWIDSAREYASRMEAYTRSQSGWEGDSIRLRQQQTLAQQQLEEFTAGESADTVRTHWQDILAAHAALADAQREHQRAVSLHALAQAMAKTAPAPAREDTLTFSEEETARRLSQCLYEQRQLEMKLGQCMGQMAQLGSRDALSRQLTEVSERIGKLEDTYAALSIAQQTLNAATAELQRRFAPRISRRATQIFAALTGNRYDRLALNEDLSLQAGAKDEDTLRSVLWRSDGTADQLYLALRLAVAEELTPEAPLILDDALVRFDDKRLAAAMSILRQTAQSKQILLFTCQNRESQY